jgi:type IV pilus assembly protein PilB
VVKNTPDPATADHGRRQLVEIDAQMRKDGFNDLRTSGLLKAMQGIDQP